MKIAGPTLENASRSAFLRGNVGDDGPHDDQDVRHRRSRRVGALAMQPAGFVHDPAAARPMMDITREAIAVGRAAGAALDDVLAAEVVDRLRAAPRETVNSLLADRFAKRQTDIDARNGIIVRFGEQHGIPTPLNRMAVTLIDAAHDSGKLG